MNCFPRTVFYAHFSPSIGIPCTFFQLQFQIATGGTSSLLVRPHRFNASMKPVYYACPLPAERAADCAARAKVASRAPSNRRCAQEGGGSPKAAHTHTHPSFLHHSPIPQTCHFLAFDSVRCARLSRLSVCRRGFCLHCEPVLMQSDKDKMLH